jgi:hypothetical protein
MGNSPVPQKALFNKAAALHAFELVNGRADSAAQKNSDDKGERYENQNIGLKHGLPSLRIADSG